MAAGIAKKNPKKVPEANKTIGYSQPKRAMSMSRALPTQLKPHAKWANPKQ